VREHEKGKIYMESDDFENNGLLPIHCRDHRFGPSTKEHIVVISNYPKQIKAGQGLKWNEKDLK